MVSMLRPRDRKSTVDGRRGDRRPSVEVGGRRHVAAYERAVAVGYVVRQNEPMTAEQWLEPDVVQRPPSSKDHPPEQILLGRWGLLFKF